MRGPCLATGAGTCSSNPLNGSLMAVYQLAEGSHGSPPCEGLTLKQAQAKSPSAAPPPGS